MMPLTEIFKVLNTSINPNVCCVVNSASGIEVVLSEKVKRSDPNPPVLRKLTLFGFDDVVAIDQDLVTCYEPILLQNKNAMRKTCDGILLASINSKPYFLVLEMKSSLSNKDQHVWKMQAGKNIVSYLKCILHEYLEIDTYEWPTLYCIFHIFDPKRATQEEEKISKNPKKPVYFCVENNDRFSALKIVDESLL